MPCDARVYENVTPKQFKALCQKADMNGLHLCGTSGTLEVNHCELVWGYRDYRLTIQCLKKPFFIGCNEVNEALDKALTL